MTNVWEACAWGVSWHLFHWHPRQGLQISISDLGATIVSLRFPNHDGVMGDVVLGYDRPEAYLEGGAYAGALVGRFANRIRDGRFDLAGRSIQLSQNDGPHHLHGGFQGFHLQRWHAEIQGSVLVMRHVSPDGTEGYPGELRAEVIFSPVDANALDVELSAVTDAVTPLNLTTHPYFNLADDQRDILDHFLSVNSTHYLPCDADRLPSHEPMPVADTQFDLRQPVRLGDRLSPVVSAIAALDGFDHCYCLGSDEQALRPAARLLESCSGRVLEVSTTAPALQVYTTNSPSFELLSQGGSLTRHRAVCLEPQNWPDQVNSHLSSQVLLHPGVRWQRRIRFSFSTLG